MNPIKFRMFVDGVGMVYRGIYDKNWYHHPVKCKPWRAINQRDHVFPLMRNTGLLDKNGVEIYEGDIIKYQLCALDITAKKTTDESDENYIMGTGVIVMKYGIFGVFDEEIKKITPLIFYSPKTVVGNIYENPELLESKS